MSKNRFTAHYYVYVLQQNSNTLKKTTSNNIEGLFQVFFTLIINVGGKYRFSVRFLHQTFIVLVFDISI